MQELRYAVRSLAARPGFFATAVVTIALGVGANTAIFSAVYSVLLRPLPFRDADRQVVLWQVRPDGEQNPVSGRAFLAWRQQARSYDGMSALAGWYYNITSGDTAEQVLGSKISASMLGMLGVRPALGRGFLESEESPGAARVAILSHELWQRRFGGDRSIVGRAANLNGEPHIVVGVMPPGFRIFPMAVDVWTPIVFDRAFGLLSHRSVVLARLRAGVSIEQAREEMGLIGRRLSTEFADTNQGWSVKVITMPDEFVGKVRPALWTLLGAVGFVLLIACANVASLLLARAATRHKEMAVRAALGAGRGRLVRQLLAESLVLSFSGALLGLAIAWGGLRLLIAANPGNLPRMEEIRLDPPMIAFTLGLALLTSVVFGLVPARAALKTDLTPALKEGSRASATPGMRHGARRLLVVSEVALSLMLLIGAALMLRSLVELETMDRGWTPQQVLSVQVNLPQARYPTPAAVVQLSRRLLENVGTLPGVTSAGITTSVPLDGQRVLGMFFSIEGRPPRAPGEQPAAPCHLVSPGYFRTAGIRMAQGRAFDERDRENAPPVAIVSRSLARRHWPGEDPLGKRIIISTPGGRGPVEAAREVVGIVEDIRYPTMKPEDSIEIYLPFEQNTWPHFHVLVRAGTEPMSLAASVRGAVRVVDVELPVYEAQAMTGLLAKVNGRPRWNSLLFGLFAAIALVLAAVGVYGVISYTVSQRVQEIGVRMAMGATAPEIGRWVLRQGLALAAGGMVIGLGGYFAVARVLARLLYGISPLDGVSIAAAVVLVGFIAIAASWAPAHRATRVDPVVALRSE